MFILRDYILKFNLLWVCFSTIKELILHKVTFSEVRLTLRSIYLLNHLEFRMRLEFLRCTFYFADMFKGTYLGGNNP